MSHPNPHPKAGETVTLSSSIPDDPDGLAGSKATVEDWWDRLTGGSWMDAAGNPACVKYAIRGAVARLPMDDEVLYFKVGSIGYLVHQSEVGR